MKGTGNGQGGNGGDDGKDDKRKFKNSKYDFEDKKDEESDTEDSCELEITPEQLIQVVPGGGVLKIKLSKRKPIEIKAGAPDGEPDPAQTKVKAIHDPINRRNEQPILNPESGIIVGVGQSVERKISLGGIRQPMLGMSREERSKIPPQRMGRSNGNDNGASDKNGDPHDHGNRPGGNRDPPDRRGGRPPRGNGNPDGGDGGSDPDDSGDGDDSSSSTDSTLPRRRGHGKPKYVYMLQGPPGLPGQEGQPGQAGRDGRGGQVLSLVRALEETLRAQRTNLDTT